LAGAIAGDEIWVSTGIYVPTSSNWRDEDDPRMRHFALKADVAAYGGFAGGETDRAQRDPVKNLTVLDGDLGPEGRAYHVVQLWHTEPYANAGSILDGFTIRNGSATHAAPGWDRSGGGMLVVTGSPTIRNCVFETNESAGPGGAVLLENGTSPVFIACVFRDNRATHHVGGAVAVFGNARALLAGCLLHNNRAWGWGGAVFASSGGRASLVNCTVAGNLAGWGGGAVHAHADGAVSVANSIVRGNMMGDVPIQVAASGGGAAAATYSNVEDGFPGPGNIDGDPAFVDVSAGDYRLASCSPCLGLGGISALAELSGTPAAMPLPAAVDMGHGGYSAAVPPPLPVPPITP
jgi:hypothetical protein